MKGLKNKFVLLAGAFVFFMTMTLNVYAEYYVVYTAYPHVICGSCCHHHYYRHHIHRHILTHHLYHHYWHPRYRIHHYEYNCYDPDMSTGDDDACVHPDMQIND